MTKIWIDQAECYVPRRGTQQSRRDYIDKTRQDNPALAINFEALPGYSDPDGPYGGDDWAVLHLGWIGPNDVLMGAHTHVHISQLPLVRTMAYGPVAQCFVAGVDDENWIDYSFYLKASYALAVLKKDGFVPEDSVLANRGERPMDCDLGELEAEAAVAEVDDAD